MSHKIKIDLCEVFEVKKGQEFRIDSLGLKYKIENNKLMVKVCNDWEESENNIVWLLKEHEIEILKPETPPEIKKMLQAFYDIGFEYFGIDGVGFSFWNTVKNGREYTYTENFYTETFAQWVKTIPESLSGDYNIKDYI